MYTVCSDNKVNLHEFLAYTYAMNIYAYMYHRSQYKSLLISMVRFYCCIGLFFIVSYMRSVTEEMSSCFFSFIFLLYSFLT